MVKFPSVSLPAEHSVVTVVFLKQPFKSSWGKKATEIVNMLKVELRAIINCCILGLSWLKL